VLVVLGAVLVLGTVLVALGVVLVAVLAGGLGAGEVLAVTLVLVATAKVPLSILLHISVLLAVHFSHSREKTLKRTLDYFKFGSLVRGSQAKQELFLSV